MPEKVESSGRHVGTSDVDVGSNLAAIIELLVAIRVLKRNTRVLIEMVLARIEEELASDGV